jgi:hypothetical protein
MLNVRASLAISCAPVSACRSSPAITEPVVECMFLTQFELALETPHLELETLDQGHGR